MLWDKLVSYIKFNWISYIIYNFIYDNKQQIRILWWSLQLVTSNVDSKYFCSIVDIVICVFSLSYLEWFLRLNYNAFFIFFEKCVANLKKIFFVWKKERYEINQSMQTLDEFNHHFFWLHEHEHLFLPQMPLLYPCGFLLLLCESQCDFGGILWLLVSYLTLWLFWWWFNKVQLS